jgi:hypothetical protein
VKSVDQALARRVVLQRWRWILERMTGAKSDNSYESSTRMEARRIWHPLMVGWCGQSSASALCASCVLSPCHDRGRAEHADMMLTAPYRSVTGSDLQLLITAPDLP